MKKFHKGGELVLNARKRLQNLKWGHHFMKLFRKIDFFKGWLPLSYFFLNEKMKKILFFSVHKITHIAIIGQIMNKLLNLCIHPIHGSHGLRIFCGMNLVFFPHMIKLHNIYLCVLGDDIYLEFGRR